MINKFSVTLGELVEQNITLPLDSYPIFDENYREELNKKIVSHFYYREIGTTIIAKWLHFLNDFMNLKMPYYNKLYESELIEFNPLNNISITETYEDENNSLSKDSSINNDTPDSDISFDDLSNSHYASNTNIAKNEETANNKYIKTTEGSSAGLPFSKAIQMYRKVLINVDEMLLDEMDKELFCQLW